MAVGGLAERLGLDLVQARPQQERIVDLRAEILGETYNRLGLHLLRLEVDNVAEDRARWAIRGADENRQRFDDAMTYAQDTAGKKLWDEAEAEVHRFDAGLATLGQLPSTRKEILREALQYFRSAAALGDPEGMWNLGWRYRLGE